MYETKAKFIAVEATNSAWYVAEENPAGFHRQGKGTMNEKAADMLAAALNGGAGSPFDLPEIRAAIRGKFVAFEDSNRRWYVAEVDAAGCYWQKAGTMGEEQAEQLAAAYNCGVQEPPFNPPTIMRETRLRGERSR